VYWSHCDETHEHSDFVSLVHKALEFTVRSNAKVLPSVARVRKSGQTNAKGRHLVAEK